MQLKVENSVHIFVLDKVKCVDEARKKKFTVFIFFHITVYTVYVIILKPFLKPL
jgi:t-SNARE complex subunit (syntaxin)